MDPRRSTAPRPSRTVRRAAERHHIIGYRLRSWALTGLLLILAGFVTGWSARADEAPSPVALAVRAAPHDGFGRIVFESPAPMGFSAAIEDGTLVIHFDQTASVTLAPIAKRLPDYVTGVPLSIEGPIVRIPLKRPVAIRTFSEGPAMVIDLVVTASAPSPTAKPESAASKEKAPEPKQAAVAAPTRSLPTTGGSAGSILPIRVGEHDDSSRLVFDLDQPLSYIVDGATGDVHLHIATQAALGPLPAQLPSRVVAIDSAVGDDGLDVHLQLPEGGRIKHFRSGPKIVVDVFGPEVAASARSATKSLAGAATPKATPEKSAAVASAATEQKPVATQPTRLLPPAPSLAAAPVGDTITTASARVPVSVSHDNDTTAIRFSWPKDVDPAAAVFVRAGYLWAVFDRSAQLDFGRWLRADGAPQSQRSGNGSIAFRLKLPDPDLSAIVTRDGNDWVVNLSADAAHPQNPNIEVRKSDNGQPHLYISTGDAGSRIALADPETGDTLLVVPMHRPGVGIAADRRYADVHLLPTGQGVAIETTADGVTADVGPSGIDIASANGLNLTPASVRVAEAPSKLGRIFDFDAWLALGGDSTDARSRLQAAVLSANAPQRNLRRLDLAHYYFATGSAAETLGVLDTIASDQREIVEEPDVKALRGAARLQMNDVAGAASDLMSPALDGERDVAPWRGAVAAAQHDWAGALRQFVRGESLIGHYPSALRVQFALSAAEAALEAGDSPQARVYLETANTLRPSNGAADRGHWLMGRMYAAFSEYDSADKEWSLAMSGGDPSIRARARFDRAMTFLDAGRMSRTDVIAELEKLQFAWRGDALEYTMLTTLGDLYLQNDDLRKGLASLRKAVTNFPTVPGIDTVAAHMRDAFVQFHADGRAAALPTLTELALFQEFRDLVPDGPTGDAIENQLVGRLIEVDLLDPAEDLLGELADRRLKGAAESKTRNQLGLVFLIDRKPQKAVDALDRPVAADADDETVNTRRQLRARALMDLEKYDEARKLLDGDNSVGATTLRADLFWRTNDWKQASLAFGKLTAALDPAKLADGDVRLVLRNTITLALAGNDRGLLDTGKRFGPAMATTPYKDAFSILTDSRQLLTPANLRTIMDQVSTADRFGAFLDSYRSQLLDKGSANPVSSKAGAGASRVEAKTASTTIN